VERKKSGAKREGEEGKVAESVDGGGNKMGREEEEVKTSNIGASPFLVATLFSLPLLSLLFMDSSIVSLLFHREQSVRACVRA
jgi:hypothetical protein